MATERDSRRVGKTIQAIYPDCSDRERLSYINRLKTLTTKKYSQGAFRQNKMLFNSVAERHHYFPTTSHIFIRNLFHLWSFFDSPTKAYAVIWEENKTKRQEACAARLEELKVLAREYSNFVRDGQSVIAAVCTCTDFVRTNIVNADNPNPSAAKPVVSVFDASQFEKIRELENIEKNERLTEDEKLTRKAYFYYEIKEYKLATMLCDEAKEINPENGHVYLLKGLLWLTKIKELRETQIMYQEHSHPNMCSCLDEVDGDLVSTTNKAAGFFVQALKNYAPDVFWDRMIRLDDLLLFCLRNASDVHEDDIATIIQKHENRFRLLCTYRTKPVLEFVLPILETVNPKLAKQCARDIYTCMIGIRAPSGPSDVKYNDLKSGILSAGAVFALFYKLNHHLSSEKNAALLKHVEKTTIDLHAVEAAKSRADYYSKLFRSTDEDVVLLQTATDATAFFKNAGDNIHHQRLALQWEYAAFRVVVKTAFELILDGKPRQQVVKLLLKHISINQLKRISGTDYWDVEMFYDDDQDYGESPIDLRSNTIHILEFDALTAIEDLYLKINLEKALSMRNTFVPVLFRKEKYAPKGHTILHFLVWYSLKETTLSLSTKSLLKEILAISDTCL